MSERDVEIVQTALNVGSRIDSGEEWQPAKDALARLTAERDEIRENWRAEMEERLTVQEIASGLREQCQREHGRADALTAENERLVAALEHIRDWQYSGDVHPRGIARAALTPQADAAGATMDNPNPARDRAPDAGARDSVTREGEITRTIEMLRGGAVPGFLR